MKNLSAVQETRFYADSLGFSCRRSQILNRKDPVINVRGGQRKPTSTSFSVLIEGYWFPTCQTNGTHQIYAVTSVGDY